MANKTVSAPKGFHWMKAGKGFKLMKGSYKPHTGAVKKASFEIQKVHKNGKSKNQKSCSSRN